MHSHPTCERSPLISSHTPSISLRDVRKGAPPADAVEAQGHDAREEEGGRRLKLVGLAAGPLLMAAVLVAPVPLTRAQHLLAGVLALSLTYWVTEALPIPVTALLALALALCVLLDVPSAPAGSDATPAELVFQHFASPVLFLLIGSFIIARSTIKYDLSRRIALRVLAIPGIARSTYLVVVVIGLLAVAIASVIETGAVVAMLLPIALGVDQTLSKQIRASAPAAADRERLHFSTALMLITAYGATIGGLLTPIGHPSNLIGRHFIHEELGVRVTLLQWVMLAFPVVAVSFVALCVIVLALNRPEVRSIPGTRRVILAEQHALGPMSRGEINTLLVFGTAIALFLLPSAVGIVAGQNSPLQLVLRARLDPSAVAILSAALLFVLPVDWRSRKFTLTWHDAMSIDWGTVLLMGAGLTLGGLMSSTGLAQLVGSSLGDVGSSPLLVYVFAAAVAVLLSETTSNTASVAIVVPIIPALAASGGGDPLTAALIATFAGSFGFMLPISTSGNAIAYSSGKIPMTKMVRTGAVVDLTGIVGTAAGIYAMVRLVGVL